jgi:ribosomal protein S11
MIARDRHYGNGPRTTLRSRIGLAAAVLAGGGAIAAGAVVATGHGAAPAKVQAAGYSSGYTSEGAMLNSALSNWGWSRQSSYYQLGRLTSARTFSQTWSHRRMLAIQRGIVVLATNKFIILQSANGSLHLWLVSGGTRFQNVSATTSGMTALTANTSAARQAMASGNMIPSTSLLAGSPTTAAQLLTPTPAAQTVTVQVANTALTVTVTITRSTATVSQTATMPWAGTPSWWQNTFTQNAWTATRSVARGDLATLVGFRSHWVLHAQLVLFAPLSTSDVGGRAFTRTTNQGSTGNTVTTGQAPTYGYRS